VEVLVRFKPTTTINFLSTPLELVEICMDVRAVVRFSLPLAYAIFFFIRCLETFRPLPFSVEIYFFVSATYSRSSS